jgi:hypothetical protein
MKHFLRGVQIGHISQLEGILAIYSTELACLVIPQDSDEV